MQPRHALLIFPMLAGLLGAPAAHAQWMRASEAGSLTVEGYANVTTAVASPDATDSRRDDPRADLALRILGRREFDAGPDLGVRLVAESSPEDRLRLAEASLLVLGSYGRLEIGERQGLPDVLTGYAPNNFSFTGAEFGPASGPSLDPGGGLQHAFLPAALSMRLDELGALGAGTSLAADRSTKIVYVSPKRRGFLGGLSFAPNAEDPRYRELIQAGLVHENYWDANILRLGGSATVARATTRGDRPARDLHSVNFGATLIWDYDLMLGISGTWNGPNTASGVTASLNYNRGRWTTGGYLEWAASRVDEVGPADDRLKAAELGVSYRISTKIRLYAAWYRFALTEERAAATSRREAGTQLLLGARAAL